MRNMARCGFVFVPGMCPASSGEVATGLALRNQSCCALIYRLSHGLDVRTAAVTVRIMGYRLHWKDWWGYV